MPTLIEKIISVDPETNLIGTVEKRLAGNRFEISLNKTRSIIARSFVAGLEIGERVTIAQTEDGFSIVGNEQAQATASNIYWIKG